MVEGGTPGTALSRLPGNGAGRVPRKDCGRDPELCAFRAPPCRPAGRDHARGAAPRSALGVFVTLLRWSARVYARKSYPSMTLDPSRSSGALRCSPVDRGRISAGSRRGLGVSRVGPHRPSEGPGWGIAVGFDGSGPEVRRGQLPFRARILDEVFR
ncbi:hypothetical protein GCM10018987_33010 [Streptomyces cremeus]